MNSIRRQLLGGLLGVVVLGLAIAAGAVYLRAHAELDELFDYQLRQMALSLRGRAFEPIVVMGPSDQGDGFDFVIQVWSSEGAQLYHSRPHAALPDRAQLGFVTITSGGAQWRIFSVQQSGTTVQVAQPMRVREELAASAALRTLTPFLVMLPIIAILIWVVIGRGLSPLEAVARAVKSRTPSALHPLPEDSLPEEVRPLVAALNDLLMRLGHALEAQRQFVADAAHELRTPLTALRLQVQLADRAQTADERTTWHTNVKRGLERASHVVQQLLTLARQEPEAAEQPFARVNPADLAREVIAERALLAEAKNIDFGMARAEPVSVSGDREALRVMLANLVDNAIRYTDPGGKVDVSILSSDGNAVIEVADNGPGIPEQERERVFDRFYRREGSGNAGSGLGLAIVKKVADRHGARIELGDGPGRRGLAVRVTLPQA